MSLWTILGVVVGGLSLLFTFYMGQRSINRENTKNEVSDATTLAVMMTELQTITRNTDEIKEDLRDNRDEVQRIGSELIEHKINMTHLVLRVDKLEALVHEKQY